MSTDRIQLAAAIAAASLALAFIAALQLLNGDINVDIDTVPRTVLFAGRFHPLIVHAPIGFLVVLTLGELRSWRSAEPALGPATRTVLWATLGACVAAYGAGVLLSLEGDYAPALVAMHQRFAGAVVASSCALLVLSTLQMRRAYRAVLLGALVTVTLAADAGGRLTHGATWLSKYAPWPSTPSAAAGPSAEAGDAGAVVVDGALATDETRRGDAGEEREVVSDADAGAGRSDTLIAASNAERPASPKPRPSMTSPRSAMTSPTTLEQPTKAPETADAGSTVDTSSTQIDPGSNSSPFVAGAAWETIVAPIFAVRCSGCHGPEKRKAKMRLDTFEGVMRGGEDGAVIVVGDPAKSMMMQRLLLPLDHEDHMPPAKRPQPTPAELDVIRWWIAQGASRDATLGQGGLAAETLASASAAVRDARRAAHDGEDGGPPAR